MFVCAPGEAISFDLQHRKGSVIVVISFVIAVIEIVDNLLLANDCIHKENSLTAVLPNDFTFYDDGV